MHNGIGFNPEKSKFDFEKPYKVMAYFLSFDHFMTISERAMASIWPSKVVEIESNCQNFTRQNMLIVLKYGRIVGYLGTTGFLQIKTDFQRIFPVSF